MGRPHGPAHRPATARPLPSHLPRVGSPLAAPPRGTPSTVSLAHCSWLSRTASLLRRIGFFCLSGVCRPLRLVLRGANEPPGTKFSDSHGTPVAHGSARSPALTLHFAGSSPRISHFSKDLKTPVLENSVYKPAAGSQMCLWLLGRPTPGLSGDRGRNRWEPTRPRHPHICTRFPSAHSLAAGSQAPSHVISARGLVWPLSLTHL